MKVAQKLWRESQGWDVTKANDIGSEADLVIAFGNRLALEDRTRFQELYTFFPNAQIVIGSTSGEIQDTQVLDNSIVATAISFESTKLAVSHINIHEVDNSFQAGEQLVSRLVGEGLSHVFVLADGQLVNGSELVYGMNNKLPGKVSVTGGLAGDGVDFRKTLVGLNEAPAEGNIVAIGFYGDRLQIGHGSRGGWDPFGPEREITRSEGNVLYELDGQSALDLYKNYLGEQADKLPGSALFFPLSVRLDADDEPLVRTILSVDEKEKAMIFAGDVPEGASARLMKANFDRLIGGAVNAADNALQGVEEFVPDLAILISCVGRKLVLGERIEEEVEGVRDVLGENAAVAGFYSYGEISPFVPEARCKLHNQTMTITTFTEV
ncbi:MAG: FIST N-terminal domain-containing protein [Bacteroidota bacterium]